MVDAEVARRGAVLKVDPAPLLVSCSNAAIAFFARRDLFDSGGEPVGLLWDLPEARRVVARQSQDGSWRYPGGKRAIRSQENYNQLETFRQLGILVEKFGFTRQHSSVERAAAYLFSFQTDEADLRGIYGNQYATTYVGAILEVLIKAGYVDDPRIARALAWLLAMRQSDGGWAIPVRTVGVPFPEFVDVKRHPQPFAPDRSKPSSHLVTGMVLRAFAAIPLGSKQQRSRKRESSLQPASTSGTPTPTGARSATGSGSRSPSGSPTSSRASTRSHGSASVPRYQRSPLHLAGCGSSNALTGRSRSSS